MGSIIAILSSMVYYPMTSVGLKSCVHFIKRCSFHSDIGKRLLRSRKMYTFISISLFDLFTDCNNL